MLKTNGISLKFPLKIIPEWELPAYVGLISPNDLLLPRDELIPFYRDLLGFLSKISETTLFAKHSNNEIFKSNQSDMLKSVHIKQIDYLSDIWIRDFAPIPAMDADENKCYVKFKYNPAYLTGKYKKLAELGNKCCMEILKSENLPFFEIPIVLDGGNLTHNGNTVIFTQRILKDNPEHSSKSLYKEFMRLFGWENILIVPEEPGDLTGHIDGLIRFIKQDTIIIGTYPEKYKKGRIFCDNLINLLKKELPSKTDIIVLENDCPVNIKKEGMDSARGNYLNFLQFGNTIIFPVYEGTSQDKIEKTSDILAKKGKIVYFSDINCDLLADFGGVLNCITCHLWS